MKERIGKYYNVISGYAFKSSDLKDSADIPIIKIGNISNGRNVIFENMQYVDLEFLTIGEKYHIKYGDVLISLTGSHINQPNSMVGRVCRNYDKQTYLLNQRAGKIIAKENASTDYMFYALLTKAMKESIVSRAYGAANQVNVSPSAIMGIKWNFPTLPTQQKIASILTSYDRLIENNTRRIRLLEQMAENLYKEWFVRFRFPEHEKVEMVNGLPKGWKVERIKECVKRLPFGRTYKAKELSQDGEVIVIDQSTSDFLGFHNNTPDHHATFNSPIILFGDHSCKFCLMTRDFSLGENLIPFISKDTKQIDNYYLYFATHKLIVTEEYKRHWGRLSSMKILIPTINIQQKFNKLIIKNEKMKKLLFIQNQHLTRQRDLLLPRLMSGKLEVKS